MFYIHVPYERIKRAFVIAIAGTLQVALVLAVFGVILAGLAVPALQIYGWLRYGNWTPFSIIDSLRLVAELFADPESPPTRLAAWLESPSSWIGLHKLLSFLHASIGLWAVALGGAYLLQDMDVKPLKPSKRAARARERKASTSVDDDDVTGDYGEQE